MDISADILKMLYQQSYNSSNTNGISSTNITGNTNGSSSLNSSESTFLGILNEAISKSSSTNLLTDVEGTDKDSKINDLSLVISMLMQQIAGNNPSNLYQNNDSNQSDEIIGNFLGTSGLGIDALTGITNNSIDASSVSNLSSFSNIDSMIEVLKGVYQGTNNSTQLNAADTANSAPVVSNVVKSDWSFPQEIMDSINSSRQAYQQIRTRIDDIRKFTGRVKLDQATVTASIEKLLATGLNAEELDKLRLSLVMTDDSNSILRTDSILDTQESVNLKQGLVNSEALLKEQDLTSKLDLTRGLGVLAAESSQQVSNTQIIEDKASISNDKSKIDIVDESIVNASLVQTKETQTDNLAVKVESEFTAVKESVFEQIKDQIITMRSDGKQSVTMQLRPEELGKLDIKMVLEKGELTIEILTSNAKAHSLILSSIPELESVIKNSMAADKNYMNFDNSKQLSEENARQNNQGYNDQSSQQQSQQEENNNKRVFEELYTNSIEDSEKIDFYTAFSRIREARVQMLNKT